MSAPRIPPIQGLLAFEALARLRSVTLAAQELSVTPSAVSHRIRQVEELLGSKLFERGDFSLSPFGSRYLERVREAIAALQQLPMGQGAGVARLRVAVTPTFSRALLLPRIGQFRQAYPEVELQLQVTIPVHNVMAEDADIELRYGSGHFPDRESRLLLGDEVTPVCSPAYRERLGLRLDDDFASEAALAQAHLIRSPLEPWRTWFKVCGITRPEPTAGSQFNDLGLVWDAAVAGFGVALLRLRLGQSWLDSGRLVRLSQRSVASPNDYYLCWRPGAMARPECAAFADWLARALAESAP